MYLISNICTEIMLQMGFSRDEIQEALTNNRYDEVMATYLLLDEKRQKLTVGNSTFHEPILLVFNWFASLHLETS